jgi:hypothetical protein
MEKLPTNDNNSIVQMDLGTLYTVKAKQIEDIEEVIKSISGQFKNKDIILEQIKDLFNKNNFIYSENNMTIDSLLLSIVLFDISGQYDKYFRESNILKIKEICHKWDITYDYISNISVFHENIILIFKGTKQ